MYTRYCAGIRVGLSLICDGAKCEDGDDNDANDEDNDDDVDDDDIGVVVAVVVGGGGCCVGDGVDVANVCIGDNGIRSFGCDSIKLSRSSRSNNGRSSFGLKMRCILWLW